MRFLKAILYVVFFGLAARVHADDARFDLAGPKIDVYVTRGYKTLPIAQVPNLLPHDQLRLKMDLPATQSNRLLLIVVFLRDTTNEPPDNWFTKIETWKQPPDGTIIVVPDDAQRALLLVAPETGGDFSTLRSAVKGNPGVFIRANGILNKASFEQQRIEHYLAGMQPVAQEDTAVIQARSAKLAATLALKPNADCYKQPVEDQVDCLTQSSAPLLLDDGHGQTVANAISTGASSDFFTEASTADNGTYSAYIGTLIDLIHLVSLLHTAQYRYIPAISFPQGATLNLKLNAPPSFNNPKSVIVVGLPSVKSASFPPLRVPDPPPPVCLMRPSTTLALRGAPLVFSTAFAHDLTLDINRSDTPDRISLMPDAMAGGLVATVEGMRRSLQHSRRSDTTNLSLLVSGRIRGSWGFDPFDGPTLIVQQLPGSNWKLTGTDALIAGQDIHITLQGEGTACISQITLTNNKGKSELIHLKPAASAAPGAIELDVPLSGYDPGQYSLVIRQYGSTRLDKLPLMAYADGIRLDHAVSHPASNMVALFGQGLENVVSLSLTGQIFTPIPHSLDNNRLELRTSIRASPALTPEAMVTLKDGRQMKVKVVAANDGSALKLISFESVPNHQKDHLEIELETKKDIPLDGKLNFVVQSEGVFPRTQAIEVATGDGSAHTTLSLNTDSLILQDDHTAVASLDLAKAFGESAFGTLQIRAVPGDGTFGSWITLGTLVRTPHITSVHCSKFEVSTCMIDGSQLFLASSFSTDESFNNPMAVPIGFDEPTFAMPTAARAEMLYVRLRDDPASVAIIRIPKR